MSPEQALAAQSAAEQQGEREPEKVVVSIPEVELTPEQLTKLEQFLAELTGAEVNTAEKTSETVREVPKVMSALALAEQAANDHKIPEAHESLALRSLRGLLKRQEGVLASMSAAELAETGETLKTQIADLRQRIDKMTAIADQPAQDLNVIDVEAKVIPEVAEPLQIEHTKDTSELPVLSDKVEIPTLTDKVGNAASMQVEQLQRDLGAPATGLVSSYDAAIARMESKDSAEGVTPKTEVIQAPEVTPASNEQTLATFEQISRAQELQTARLKGNLLERGLTKLEQSPTLEAYRKMNWKKKVALGVLMGTAGAAAMGTGAAPAAIAAGLAFRGLGLVSTYTGFIERAKKKNFETGSVIITDQAGEVIVDTTSADRLKALGLTALVGLLLPQALKEGLTTVAETEVGQNIIGYAGDKISEIGSKLSALKDVFGEKLPPTPAAAVLAEAPELPIETADVAPAAAAAELAVGKVVPIEIKTGDTAYSVLRKMIPDIEKLDGATRQNNAIENILSKMKAHPGGLAAFGISSGNINELKPGESIDVTKIQSILDTAKMSSGKGILEHAASLSDDTIRRIQSFSQPAAHTPIADISGTTEGVGPLGRTDTVTPFPPNTVVEDLTHADDGTVLQTAQNTAGNGAIGAGAEIPADAAPLNGGQAVVSGETLAAAAAKSPKVLINPSWAKLDGSLPAEKVSVLYNSGRIVYDKTTGAWYDTGIDNYTNKLQTGALPAEELARLKGQAAASVATGAPRSAVLPEAPLPSTARVRLPEAPLPGTESAHAFNLNAAQLQALNKQQDEMILGAFYKTGTIRQNQGLIKNIFTGIFGTGNGSGAGRQVAEQIGTQIGQQAMSAQELAAAKAEWLKFKDIPASDIMSGRTPGPLNALKTKLENLSMGVLPQPQPGQTFDSYMRNILANAIKQGRSINV